MGKQEKIWKLAELPLEGDEGQPKAADVTASVTATAAVAPGAPDLAMELFGPDAPAESAVTAAAPPELTAARERFARAHRRWIVAEHQASVARGRLAELDVRIAKGTEYLAKRQHLRDAQTEKWRQLLDGLKAEAEPLRHNVVDYTAWSEGAQRDMDAAEADVKRLLGVTDASSSYLCPWCQVLVQQADSVQHARACWGVQVQAIARPKS